MMRMRNAKFVLCSPWALLLLVLASGCDDEPSQVDDVPDVAVVPCPETGARLEATAVDLELKGMANRPIEQQLLLTNTGTESLCFDEDFYSIVPADAALTLSWDSEFGSLAPEQSVALQMSFIPPGVGSAELVLNLRSLNGGEATLRFHYSATPCEGEDCPPALARHYCASTSSGKAGRASVRFELTNAARPTLLAANPGVEQSFVSLTPPSGPVDRFDLFYWSIGRQCEVGFEVLMPGVDA
ncbi:MAG: hypothetical protein RBU37_17060, partial [Myxococcota bacterium]|nr:hypothetical protein [Myxococcota bacterium]